MVSTRFWSDPWVVDELNPLDRYLFLYLLTNEKTNIAGVYELSLRTMSNETGLEKEELQRMLKRLETRIVYVLGWVVFRKAIKHQNYRSPKIEAAVARELREVPLDVLKYVEMPNYFGQLLQEQYGIDTVPIPYASGIAPNLTKPNLTKPNLTKPNAGSDNQPKTAGEDKSPKIKTEQIDSLFGYWKEKVGYAVTSQVRSNREYASKLLKEYTEEDVHRMIDGVAMSHSDQFAPRISNFTQLYRKWDDLKAWGRRSMHDQQKGRGVVI